jgi:hypothetical protein
MRQHRRKTVNTITHRPSAHAVRAAAAAVHAEPRGGYTPTEHARAMDRLLADIMIAEATRPGGDAEIHEPKLRLTAPMTTRDIIRDRTNTTDPVAHHA